MKLPPALKINKRAPRYYTYYKNRRNLLKETSTPEGLSIIYDYHPRTNLRTKTLCKYQDKIQERTFCTYDENGEIKTITEDDGSSEDPENLDEVSFRKIKKITVVAEEGAAFGKPEKISEYYLDPAGKDILLTVTQIAYDAKGCETERQIFNSEGILCYTTAKIYDEKLLLVSETNPLGHRILYHYDDNHNKIEEEHLESKKSIHYTYDFGNRLKEKKEIDEDKKIFTASYAYNSLDQLIEETDPYGQKTIYRYDRMGNTIECVKPLIQDGDGDIISPATTKKYNALNQVIEKTDENGHLTKYAYNCYGSPTKITHPDGSKEQLTYSPNGWLKKKNNPDGTYFL